MGQGSSNTKQFTGHERDPESGLDYMLARYYVSTGRFMSPDPLAGHLEFPQTLNRYIYAGNNPLKYVDPDGLDFYLKCSGESATCHKGRVGSYKTKKDGSQGRFKKTVVKEKDGTLVDQNGNQYSGSVDGSGVHLATQAGGVTSSYIGVWKRNSAPVNFTESSGPLAGATYHFLHNPHFGQDARGTFEYPGSREKADEALAKAGLFPTEGGAHIGKDEFRSSGGPEGDNETHFSLERDSGSPVTGDFHTGEYSPDAHPWKHGFQAAIDFVQWAAEKLVNP